MGSAERRERERQETREAILDAARTILGQRGYDGLTMRAVADRIEYTPAALYKHFTDREQLVRELCAEDFYGFNKVLLEKRGATKTDSKDPYAVLRAIGQGYAEFALKYPEQYRVMFMTPLPEDGRLVEPQSPESDAYQTALQAVTEAQALGCFPGLGAELVAQTLWATMHGVVSIEIAHMCVTKRKIPFAPIDARIHAAVESALLGLEALAKQKAHAPRRSTRAPRRRR